MPADYAGVDLFQAFALLFAGSVALLTVLALLVVSRKALRDRREGKSARRRRHHRTASGWRWCARRRSGPCCAPTGWGEMTRVGFSEPVPAVAQGISSPSDG